MDEIDKKEWYQEVSLEDAKLFIKNNMSSAARSFIAVGYYLKHIRDKELYQEEGHANIWEFAASEYGLSKSTASRYMTMNDRFSREGNSPIIKEEFREFGRSQLQEMLGLSDEQLEQVTPDTMVKQIREMKREILTPYIGPQVPGQFEITDFPDFLPEEMMEAASESVLSQPVKTLLTIEDMIGAAEMQQEEESVAISQHELPVSTDEYDYCPPDNHGCMRQEWGTDPEAQKRGSEECRKCWQHCKKLNTVLETTVESPESVSSAEHEVIPEQTEPVIEAEFTEIQEPEGEYALEYFLAEQNQKLTELLNALKDVAPEHIPRKVVERQKMIVCALAAMKADLDMEEFKRAYKPEQPELPILKNNDQRAAFVDAYETWPLWIETEQTGERYYRYDLLDETSMVVKVYHTMLFDYKAEPETKYEDRFKEGYGNQEYYLLQDGKFFRDCDTNRSILIEKLKGIQRKDK